MYTVAMVCIEGYVPVFQYRPTARQWQTKKQVVSKIFPCMQNFSNKENAKIHELVPKDIDVCLSK